ncbi:MAG: chemotaxis protein CheX [Deltaproteobacteria bacterium]|nr:chemotaxis protein CheX [Deltaproteobacteria bacterium]
MNTRDIQNVLDSVVPHVFEGMYFMFPEVIREDLQPPMPTLCFRASVAIQNSPFKVVVYGSEKLVQDMAAALLGEGQGVTEKDLKDIFKEAANLIGGNLVTSLAFDKDLVLDVPEVEVLDSPADSDTEPGTVFDVDGEFLKVAVL